tara:strand:+ start:61 stop:405 length:345 start_codon:yes stop_codon:yes gene_type:complete
MQRLLIKNTANSYSCGDVIHIYKGNETPGNYESKTVFLASGLSANDWPRQFVIVNIPDATEGDYDHLLENNIDETRKYYVTPQGKESPFYDELLLNAEISVPKSVFNPLIVSKV